MSNVLIVYTSRHGQSAKVAKYVADVMWHLSLNPHILNLKDCKDINPVRPEDYKSIIVIGAVFFGNHPRRLKQFVRRNSAYLTRVPSAFLSISMSAASKSPKQHARARKLAAKFLTQTSWIPTQVHLVGGAAPVEQYNPFVKILMRVLMRLRKVDYDHKVGVEHTDWDDLLGVAQNLTAMKK